MKTLAILLQLILWGAVGVCIIAIAPAVLLVPAGAWLICALDARTRR